VLELPRLMVGGAVGSVLTGLVVAGAFAAFLSTSSGLSLAVSGVLGQEVAKRSWRGHRIGGVAAFRLAAVVAVAVPLVAALASTNVGVARAVGLAFAVAASTFCPLLVLGIWWRGLTDVGAVAGLLAGLVGSGTAVVWVLGPDPGTGWRATLLEQPAAWSVPLAFATMVGVSLLTRSRVPSDAWATLVRLHTPEALVER
jgi:Na+(H+)/acetate symporter ActP